MDGLYFAFLLTGIILDVYIIYSIIVIYMRLDEITNMTKDIGTQVAR